MEIDKGNVNWQEYRENFPKRYLERGFFDDEVLKVAAGIRPKTILDIGGGEDGTQVLKGLGIETWILDPYVEKPWWMKGQVNWTRNNFQEDEFREGLQKFDLIVCRGSLNYFTKEELVQIPLRLNRNGIFLSNTFSFPPAMDKWVSRPFENLKGEKGIERFYFHRFTDVSDGMVEHELKINGKIITHSFMYRAPDYWHYIFPDVGLTRYGVNSLLLKYVGL